MPLIKAKVFHIGGEDVRMRIPILKKMIEKGYFVAAVGCGDQSAFKGTSIQYHDYTQV